MEIIIFFPATQDLWFKNHAWIIFFGYSRFIILNYGWIIISVNWILLLVLEMKINLLYLRFSIWLTCWTVVSSFLNGYFMTFQSLLWWILPPYDKWHFFIEKLFHLNHEQTYHWSRGVTSFTYNLLGFSFSMSCSIHNFNPRTGLRGKLITRITVQMQCFIAHKGPNVEKTIKDRKQVGGQSIGSTPVHNICT